MRWLLAAANLHQYTGRHPILLRRLIAHGEERAEQVIANAHASTNRVAAASATASGVNP
jgi:hypothetical protein